MVVGTVVQVTNVSASVTDKQLRDLFGIFGDVLELKLYPTASVTSKPRIGYVKYDEHETCLVAQHLTNTILLDRPLVVTPVAADDVPDEKTALAASEPSEAAPTSFSTSALAATAQTLISQPALMPTPMSAVPVNLASLNLASIQPMPGANPIMQCLSPAPVPCQLVTGMQAKAGMGRSLWDAISALAPTVSDPPLPGMVPSAPPLGGNVDPSKIEEIRRTVYVGNLNTQLLGEALVPFFAARCGEVMYVRMAGDETQPTRFVFIEFADVNAVNMALQYNGAMFGDRPLKVNHSKNAVVKPQVKLPDVGQREVMEAVRKAQAAISQQIEPEEQKKAASPSPQRHRSSRTSRRSGSRERRRSRSRERRRSASRDRRERRRSGSRERQRDRHSGRYDRRSDRDRDRDRNRDRDRERERERDDTRRRERSPAHRSSRRHSSRSPEAKPERRRSRSRDRTERKRRRSRSKSPEARVTRRRSPSSSASPERPSSRKHRRRERSKERSTKRRQPSSSPPRPPPPTAAALEDDEDEVSMSESD